MFWRAGNMGDDQPTTGLDLDTSGPGGRAVAPPAVLGTRYTGDGARERPALFGGSPRDCVHQARMPQRATRANTGCDEARVLIPQTLRPDPPGRGLAPRREPACS